MVEAMSGSWRGKDVASREYHEYISLFIKLSLSVCPKPYLHL
jgi:hypothetical protein